MYGMQQLCVLVERLALSERKRERGGDPRGNGLENKRDASDGKVSEVSGEQGKKEPTVTPPLFCLSFLSARAHRDVAAAFCVYIKRATTKETEESDMDLICIAIPPYSHCIPHPNVTTSRLLWPQVDLF